MDRFRKFWFGAIDPRPVELFRIVFAGLLLKDALYHLPLAHLFYSDAGLLPRPLLIGSMARLERFSLLDAVSTDWMAQGVFGLWALVALALLVGYRARWMTVINFLLVLSIHERNVYVLTGADTALRVFSFWLMFIPVGRYYALDARRVTAPIPIPAFPVRLLQMQIALIYVTAAALKFIGTHWLEGHALYEVLQLETMLLPPGDWLRNVLPVWALTGLTWGILLVELLFPVLVFFPLWQPRLRAFALFSGTLLHVGVALALAIPDFSLVMLSGYLVFFEPGWIQRLLRWLRRDPTLQTVHEQTVAPGRQFGTPDAKASGYISQKSLLKQIKKLGWSIRFLPNPTPDPSPQAGRGMPPPSTGEDGGGFVPYLILKEHQQARDDSVRTGGLHISSSNIQFGFSLELPSPFGAARRHCRPGQGVRSDANEPSTSHPARQRYLYPVLALLMTAVIGWNMSVISDYSGASGMTLPAPVQSLMWYSGLWQYWDLFAPLPRQVDGWLVVPGVFDDGSQVNLLNGGPLTETRLDLRFGPWARWMKWGDNLFDYQYEPLLRRWTDYYCRLYAPDTGSNRRLVSVQIIFWHRRVHLSDTPPNPLQLAVLWSRFCDDS